MFSSIFPQTHFLVSFIGFEKRRVFGVLFSVLLLFLNVFTYDVHADENEKYFFSPDRLELNQEVAYSIIYGGVAQRDVKDFVRYYSRGRHLLSAGDYQEAEDVLKRARKAWPEFFAVDFLIALTYEGRNEHSVAARYYKSYLIKLKALNSGEYGISGPLIRSLLPGRSDTILAEGVISRRLAKEGIVLANVRPALDMPYFLVPIFFGMFAAAAYIFIRYKLMPYLHRRYRVAHPPEGFWVCPKCGEENPGPLKECGECGYEKRQKD